MLVRPHITKLYWADNNHSFPQGSRRMQLIPECLRCGKMTSWTAYAPVMSILSSYLGKRVTWKHCRASKRATGALFVYFPHSSISDYNPSAEFGLCQVTAIQPATFTIGSWPPMKARWLICGQSLLVGRACSIHLNKKFLDNKTI